MVKIAVVQCGSLVYDTPKTLEKLEALTSEAASNGAELVLFPGLFLHHIAFVYNVKEAFIGGYPKGLDFGVRLGTRSSEGRDEFKRYFDGAISYDGEESETLSKTAKTHNVYLVVGVVERDGGTLYCSVFFYGPDGRKMGKHRKLMPTALERVVWGFGDGSTLPVFHTNIGKMGAAICWENYMPALRMSYYNKGIQLYLAPTVDDRDSWLSTMRTIALEGRCFVISACQFLTSSNFPEDHPARQSSSETVLIRGGSCAVSPLGEILLEPQFNSESVNYVECDLADILRGKFDLDVVGHYARPDVFQLTVNVSEQNAVVTNALTNK
jgi:nitrilase